MYLIILNICTNSNVLKVIYFLKQLFKIVMITIPIFVIIKITIKICKAIFNDSLKFSQVLKESLLKILTMIIIFIIPWFVSIFLHIINEKTDYESCIDNANLATIEKYQKLEDIKQQEEENKHNNGNDNGPTISVPADRLSSIKISSISNKGSVINIKVSSSGKKIIGYYFNYSNNLPTKDNSGYLETSKSELELVRLPGKSYIWVEDENHKLSQTKTIDIPVSAIANKKGKMIKGISLKTVLENNGTSVNDFSNLIYRSARAAKLKNKEAAATAAVALVDGLYQKYNIRLPYRAGGKFFNYGALGDWGKRINDNVYYTFDCDGFSHWAFTNAGLNIRNGVVASANGDRSQNYWYWDKDPLTKDNGEVGDVITQTKPNAHVQVVVGKTDKSYVIAHANGTNNGVWISELSFNSINKYDYKLIKGDKITSFYPENPKTYPSGF